MVVRGSEASLWTAVKWSFGPIQSPDRLQFLKDWTKSSKTYERPQKAEKHSARWVHHWLCPREEECSGLLKMSDVHKGRTIKIKVRPASWHFKTLKEISLWWSNSNLKRLCQCGQRCSSKSPWTALTTIWTDLTSSKNNCMLRLTTFQSKSSLTLKIDSASSFKKKMRPPVEF